MATVLTSKYKGMVISGEVISGNGTKDGLRITSWVLDSGKAAPSAAGLVGKSFESVNKAGKASLAAARKFLGLGPLPNNYMVFYADGSNKPYATREYKPKDKVSVNGTKPESMKAAVATKNGASKKETTAKTVKESTVTAEPKRGRGRPPTSTAKATTRAESSSKSTTTAAETRGRGRPRKVAEEEIEELEI